MTSTKLFAVFIAFVLVLLSTSKAEPEPVPEPRPFWWTLIGAAANLISNAFSGPPGVLPMLESNGTEKRTTRVIGGKPARPHQFPYQVGMMIKVGEYGAWCGGSVISKNYILTAAHCFRGAEAAMVYVGAHEYEKDEEGQRRFRVTTENFIVHENYNPKTVQNDIALVYIPEEIKEDKYVKYMKLNTDPKRDLSKSKLRISGWGLMADDSQPPKKLQFADLKSYPLDKCAEVYPGYIQPTNICTDSSNGRSTCNGDSGGPLVEVDTGLQVGLTSFGSKKGCEKKLPSVYTGVANYVDWISKNTKNQVKF